MAKNNRIIQFIKSLDFYRVLPRELTEPSLTGASSKFVLNQ